MEGKGCRSAVLLPPPEFRWKHGPPLCHPERSRGICGPPIHHRIWMEASARGLDRSKLRKGTMRNQPFIVASIAALLLFGASTSAQPQEQSQPVPDAPQPQKK